jgi:gluconokinase
MIILLMGVTGAGKTTVGRALAAELRWNFADADDFHSPANVAKMHAGIPLDDADRAPWLVALHNAIIGWIQKNESVVLHVLH